MPIQYFYSEPDNVLCVKIKVPVVLAEEEITVTVDSITSLPELAKKIDHIDPKLYDFKGTPLFTHQNGDRWNSFFEEEGWEKFGWKFCDHGQPVLSKIMISGTLHKQIYYVDKDDHVKHFGEDIPFSDDVSLDIEQPVVDEDDVYIQLHHKRIDMRWSLRRGCRLQQYGVMVFEVKAVEERQIFVQVCPRLDKKCERGLNLVKDGELKHWANDTTPIFWGASNVVRENGGARLGDEPAESASLYQTISNDIVPTGQYRLCFDALEVVGQQQEVGLGGETLGGTTGTASFTLSAEIAFYDKFGNLLYSEMQTYTPSQISDNDPTKLCINATAPEGVKETLIRFTFEPTVVNTSAVVLDNIKFECTRIQDKYYENF